MQFKPGFVFRVEVGFIKSSVDRLCQHLAIAQQEFTRHRSAVPVHVLGHIGMVGGQLALVIRTCCIKPAVAKISVNVIFAVDQHGGKRCSHTLERGVVKHLFSDDVLGQGEAFRKHVFQVSRFEIAGKIF